MRRHRSLCGVCVCVEVVGGCGGVWADSSRSVDRLGASFVPVRKAGKLPGETVTEAYEKEYGTDHFEMQADAIRKGQKVVIVDDIIATGGSAAAAGKMVRRMGGELLGYVFMKELAFLKGREKLDAKVFTLLDG